MKKLNIEYKKDNQWFKFSFKSTGVILPIIIVMGCVIYLVSTLKGTNLVTPQVYNHSIQQPKQMEPIKPEEFVGPPKLDPNQISEVNLINKKLDALLLAIGIDKACYDKLNNLWFVHNPKSIGTWKKGWYYEEDKFITFKLLSNDTILLTTETSQIFNNRISLNEEGLQCLD